MALRVPTDLHISRTDSRPPFFYSRLSTLAFIALAALTAPALAHETAPANWCTAPNTQPQIASSFNFTRQQILTMAAEVEQALGPEGLIAEGLAERTADGRCGIVDRWKMAVYILQHHCAAQTGNANAIFNVTSPTSFLGPSHHTAYNYTGGVQGTCAICVVPSP
jgi:hypothetical protein